MPTRFRYHTKLSVPNTSGRCSVIIRVCYNGRVDLYTGITILPTQWSEKKERVKQGCVVGGFQYNVLNNQIGEQEKFVEEYFNNSAARSALPTLQDLKQKFNQTFKTTAGQKVDEFFVLFDEFRKEKEKERGWGKDIIDVFARLKEKIRVFNPNLRFTDLSIATMNAIKEHLSKSMYNDALKKHLSYFKQFVTWAQKRGHLIHEEYFTFSPRLPLAKKAVRYLTLGELDTIYNLDLTENEALDKVRDIFIFQCYTALRFSDVKALKHSNIKMNEEGVYYLDLLTEKDDDRISFRLAKRATKIYLKYKDNVYENDLVFPVISNQKYNDHLKELGKLADLQGEWIDYEYRLNEKITVKIPKYQLSSHTARRTFVVTAMNENMDLNLVAMITSHSDLNAMKSYITANTMGTDRVIDAIDNAGSKTED